MPGEDPAEFKKLHRSLIEEFRPNGRMEEETVASIARLMWRRQNLAHFEIGQLSYFITQSIEKAIARERTNTKEGKAPISSKQDKELISESEQLLEARKRVDEAEGKRKEEAAGEFFEASKVATLNRLMKELDVEERLDAMIDKLIKRLLFVRGVKSINSSADGPSPSSASKRLRAT